MQYGNDLTLFEKSPKIYDHPALWYHYRLRLDYVYIG